jgi:hypothetical protein
MQLLRSKLTFANVIALLALFVALSGSAYAIHLGKNAVKTKNIKNGAVIESKLAGGSVSSAKLAGGSVSSAKLAPGALRAAGLGDVVIRTASKPMPDGSSGFAIATCLPGERLLSGSEGVSAGNSPDIVVNTAQPTMGDGSLPTGGQSPTSWTVYANNYPGDDTSAASVVAYAVCLK